MNINSRKEAFKILEEIDRDKGYGNIVLNRRTKHLDLRDRNFIREIVYGVLENRIMLDYVIESHSKIRLKKLSSSVKLILGMAIYQILKMDRVPDSAAVDEAVKLSKKTCNRGAQGYINGVLRNIVRNKDSIILPSRDSDFTKYISVTYSYPEWMVKRWIESYGESFTEELCIANTRKSPLTIRVNRLITNRQLLSKRLEDEGMRTKQTKYGRDTLCVLNPDNITESQSYREGLYTIQGESSSLVGQVLNPKEGSSLLDICSAPGGKATQIAELMKNRGRVVAKDIHPHKISLIEDSARRLGIDIIEASVGDGRILDDKLIDSFDYCLVDVPCSALGLIGKKPEIKYNKTEGDLDELPSIQLEILENASRYLKSGGEMIYSTCTINREENMGVIESFLSKNDGFALRSFADNLSIDGAERGYVEIYPNVHGIDGFFIAKLQKL